MNKQFLEGMRRHILGIVSVRYFAVVVFLLFSFFLTYRILFLPSLVIGDNFYWTKLNTVDILGLRVIRESYLGDIAVLSTFKNGYLFPLTYTIRSINLPVTLIYPFIFYSLSMLAFYALSIEFLRNRFLPIIVSTMYVINPVTPYYFTSIISAFTLVFLPLTLKFFIRTLRKMNQESKPQHASKSFALSGLFLALSISAHEQFFLSSALIAVYLMLTFAIVCFRKYNQPRQFVRILFTNILVFILILFTVNIPLVLSLSNIRNTPLATYYTGRFNDFLANVRYSYMNADLSTLLRLGGDSGTGLGNNPWYDSSMYTNLFGYSLFTVFIASILILALRKEKVSADKPFFYMNILLFFNSILLIEFMKNLPSNPDFSERLFSFLLQTWESPGKLRAILLLSALTTTLVVFRKLESYGETRKRKIFKGSAIALLILSMIAYNSPWLISYSGYTPLQQISDNLKWGKLFESKYSQLTGLLEENYADERGLVIPYTHKTELYVPPNFRLFQLVSPITEQAIGLTQTGFVPWSRLLGILSTKYVVLNEDYESNGEFIFPKLSDNDISQALEQIESDGGLEFLEKLDSYTIFENRNSLPTIYATEFFVFYDTVGTLKYAVQRVDFEDLPVFISSGDQINQFSVPEFVGEYLYEVNAISLPNSNSTSDLILLITNSGEVRELNLHKIATIDDADLFSAVCRLSSNDTVKVAEPETWKEAKKINQLVLNSTSFSLGDYGSFMLNFTVNILERGQYSFLAPRVLIDVGESKKYFIIFNDNGFVELAVLHDDVFTSGLKTTYVGYNLESESDFIDVAVMRNFDEVQVYVNNNQVMFFPTESKVSTVSLSSEYSISNFSDIHVATRNILRLFASRQVSTQPDFYLQQKDPNKSVLFVSHGETEYAVVSQYLQTKLRDIEVKKCEIEANVFFQGWIVESSDMDSKELLITIGIRDSEIMIGLTFFSIFLTPLILIIGTMPTTVFSRVYTCIKRIKTAIGRKKAEADV